MFLSHLVKGNLIFPATFFNKRASPPETYIQAGDQRGLEFSGQHRLFVDMGAELLIRLIILEIREIKGLQNLPIYSWC
jgi:hypothetical protein